MTTGIFQEPNLEKRIEKQMGCMAGFLQIFDRHQSLTGKRLYSTKRLPPTPAADSTAESEKSIESPAISREFEKPHPGKSIPSPDRFKQSPVTELRSPSPSPSPAQEPVTPLRTESKMVIPLSAFESKEGSRSSWKFRKEAPRLSLDSRAVVDAKGSLKPREIRTNAAILSVNRCENGEETAGEGEDMETQRRSTSVIARLMGLEPLLNSDPEPTKKAELRRSASESRVSKDQYRFIDGINFQLKQSQPSNSQMNAGQNQNNNAAREERMLYGRHEDRKQFNVRNLRGEPAKAPQRVQRKSFYDSADFFPEPKQSISIYGEIEKRLKMRGIDESSKDLETLKQILEALQMKGLLHPKKPSIQASNIRNFVYDESPIVVMKPGTINRQGRAGNDSSSPSSFRRAGTRRNSNFSGEMSPAVSPRCDRPEIDRNVRNQSSPSRGRNSISPTRSETSIKSPSRIRPMSIDTRRKMNNESTDQRRVSPRSKVRGIGSDQTTKTTTNRPPRLTKPTAEICQKDVKLFASAEDEVSTVSECSISTCSHTDTEKYKCEGRSLLERCDKLINSIAEITASELQPSPVSVLDSSFYKDESSPSPVMKRSIDFKDQQIELEDDIWSLGLSSVESKSEEDDGDFIYISDILRASTYLPEDSDVFLLLEKQQYLKGKDNSKVSRVQRKLIFDTINEILNRRRQLPPWKVVSYSNSSSGQDSLQLVWCEFQKIRERDSSEDMFNVICGVLKKDLASDAINGDYPIQMSETVLDIERLIFKDLIGETIRDLAAFSRKCAPVVAVPRRMLIF